MRYKAFLIPTAIALALSGAPAVAAPSGPGQSGNPNGVVDLNVLFVSAHPDDEASTLATLAQWKEKHGVRSGVVTITRGEGGGNAVGLEEGPPLGLLREAEERSAIGRAGVENLYNLDRVDFWYTASAPLSEQIWGHDETLAQIVRVIRQTKPEIIMTMNPSPTPGNHGNHQQAAQFAAEAFHAAADPNAFPEQLSKEGLQPFRPAKFLRTGGTGSSSTGPNCAASFTPTVPTDQVFGVWEGVVSQSGKTFGEIEVEARRDYVSQGWGNSAAAPTDPARVRCDFFTLVDSRVPYDPADTSPEAILRGSVLPHLPGGLPQDTEFYLTSDRFDLTPGQTVEVTAHVRGGKEALPNANITLRLPEGWTATGSGALKGAVAPGKEKTATFTVQVPANATVNQQSLLGATLTTSKGTGRTDRAVRVVADVRGTLEPLPEVGIFRNWASDQGFPQLDTLIQPVLTLGSGKSREVRVDLRNHGSTAQSGTVTLGLPAGFTADATTKSYASLAPGETGAVTFTVTNSDSSLPTANEGGDYPVTITTTSQSGTNVETGALEIVPTTVVPRAWGGDHAHDHDHDADIDGVASPGEYPGEELDFSRIWEGQATTPQDASAKGYIAFTDDALKVFVQVTDDVLGRKVVAEDCKRQRRTDSVEIIVDPKGNSANTSTVFKAGIFPITDDPANGNPPCWQRDADNFQGPGDVTAPGMKVVSKVSEPYTGYTIETIIPFSVLPDAVDPDHMGFNVLVYDADTQEFGSQSRLGWSTWNGVRADPYRYGLVTLPGYNPPAREPSTPKYPDTAARSVHSPQTIAQSAWDGVAPAAVAKLPANSLKVNKTKAVANGIEVTLRADKAGTAYLYSWDGTQAHGSQTVELSAKQTVTVVVPSTASADSLLVAFESGDAARAWQFSVN